MEEESAVCGKMCSSSEPCGTSENVGRVVKEGMDMDAGKSWASVVGVKHKLATVTPFGRGISQERRAVSEMSN